MTRRPGIERVEGQPRNVRLIRVIECQGDRAVLREVQVQGQQLGNDDNQLPYCFVVHRFKVHLLDFGSTLRWPGYSDDHFSRGDFAFGAQLACAFRLTIFVCAH